MVDATVTDKCIIVLLNQMRLDVSIRQTFLASLIKRIRKVPLPFNAERHHNKTFGRIFSDKTRLWFCGTIYNYLTCEKKFVGWLH